jgi:Flp pilus assembly protein TadD
MPKATRLSFPLAVLLLGCTAMSSNAGWFDFGSKPEASTKDDVKGGVKDARTAAPLPAVNLDDSIRQAQMLRLAGSYPEAIKHLSQLMMVASDDPRVVSEYGKTLAAMGRADDAVNFLTRAQQLQPNDWTVYSALGVAYDQLGNQKEAQPAYERALALKPGEPSVLSNYALSRMLAKDPDTAKKLAARAEIANASAADPKIARNIAMIRSMAPEAPDAAMAVNNPAPSPVPRMVAAAPQVPAARQTAPFVNLPAPVVAPPRPLALTASNGVIQARPQAPDNRVVMQRVPVDPLAGPVQGAAKVGPVSIVATHAPRPLQFKTERATAKNEPAAKPEAPKPAPASATGVKSAAAQAEDLQARAEAIAKQLAGKPAAIAAAKTEANKDVAAKTEANKAPAAQTAANKPAPSVPMPKVLPPTQVKAAEAKPAPSALAPKVLPPTPGKVAEAKPAAQKTAVKPKDSIPGLRLSANAY